jgi:hypothetical protein
MTQRASEKRTTVYMPLSTRDRIRNGAKRMKMQMIDYMAYLLTEDEKAAGTVPK